MFGGLVGRFEWGNGLLFDLAVMLNADPAAQPDTRTAVVAIDAESLSSGALSKIPRALMQPVLAEALEALLAAGTDAVAFDILLSYSGNRWKPDHDRPLLRALYDGRGRVVLGRSSNSLPADPFVAALGFDRNALGAMELMPEPDGAYRQVRSGTRLENGEIVPGLVAATLANAGHRVPPDIMLAGWDRAFALPVYAFSDLLACSRTDSAAVRAAFAGRVVFVGSWLDEEDRKRSSNRFVRLPERSSGEAATAAGCSLTALRTSISPESVPGVLLHALAAESVLSGEVIHTVDWPFVALLTGLASGFGVLAAMALSPALSLPLGAMGAALIFGLSCVLLSGAIWLPPAAPVVGGFTGTLLVFPIRFLRERAQRFGIHRAFRQYLAPEMVERIMRDPGQLHLGGEVRELTVLFCDMRGFTAFSERMSDRPEELVRLLNRLLSVLTEPVLKHGGTVDKYMGDAVMAFWNAPIADPDHARNAVSAALEMLEAVRKLNTERKADGGDDAFRVGIGIHTGKAIVGNMGSDRRFNYTAIGDTVNLASRLESQCKVFGADLIVSEETLAHAPGLAALELAPVTVKGRSRAANIFAVMGGPALAATANFKRLQKKHSSFLDHCRRGEGKEARSLALDLAADNPALRQFYRTYSEALRPATVRNPAET
nr:adenylate/guanylate cyclase domain-containing protein [Nisaea sediminum]